MIAQADNWPEEEAQCTAIQYRGLIEDDGKEYADQWLERQRVHMEKVFNNVADFGRYTTELNFLIKENFS